MNQDGRQQARVTVGSVTEDDEFYLEWARETQKKNVSIANDALQKLVTLDSALLGGSLTLYDKTILPEWIHPMVVLAFFISLILSVIGTWPSDKSVDQRSPTEIKEAKNGILRTKMNLLLGAGLCLCMGFVFCIFGFVMNQIGMK